MRISALLRQAQDSHPVEKLLHNTTYLWKELGNALSPTSSRSLVLEDVFGLAPDQKSREAEKVLNDLRNKLTDAYHMTYEAMKKLSHLKS